MNYQIFGPVPSRRLGFSLGVDIIPFKTCSLDCIYCQLGRTTDKTLERKEFFSPDDILKELKKILKNKPERVDYITFSGSGEPTLNSKIGDMILRIKKITSTPVAVLTNGTLLYHPELQEELKEADLVIPSLDAADEKAFQEVNRPHPSLNLDEIIRGLITFSRKFKGKIWLEIMLIRGINDSPQHIEKLAQIIRKIKLDKVQLNTPVRPPAEEFVHPVSISGLRRISSILGKKCEILAQVKRAGGKAYQRNVEEAVLEMLRRRPLTLEDISNSLGIHQNEAVKYIQALGEKGLISSRTYSKRRYYLQIRKKSS